MSLWRPSGGTAATLTGVTTLAIPANPDRLTLFISGAIEQQVNIYAAAGTGSADLFAFLRTNFPTVFVDNHMIGEKIRGAFTLQNTNGTTFISWTETSVP